MTGYSKEKLKNDYEIAQRTRALREGKAVMQDGVYVTEEDIAELASFNQRLADDGEKAELLYLDDKRCVRVCAIKTVFQQQSAVSQDKSRDQVQSPAPATSPQPRREAAPSPARA